jgi:hypothetical protein
MFLTSPYIDQAITCFDHWSISDMAMFLHLRQPLAVAAQITSGLPTTQPVPAASPYIEVFVPPHLRNPRSCYKRADKLLEWRSN